MLGINRDLTVYRCGDTINAECLVGSGVVGFCLDNPLRSQFLVHRSRNGIFENTFIGTVAFFGNLAGGAVLQNTDAEGGKNGGICFIQYRNHIEHHLGRIATAVMPPVKEKVFSPGYNSGKPSPDTVSFFDSVPL